jgi:putative Ca2+/H+ antiporter (TMEM165/GDT1 family)
MNTLWTTILVVFVAEFGDKSQLLALSLGARHRLWPLMTGAFCAFAATTLLSATAGGMIAVAIPATVIAYVSGSIFLGFGLWTLWPALKRSDTLPLTKTADQDPEGSRDSATPNDASIPTGWWRVFTLAFVAMFLAEFGDKTMLVTAALATRGHLISVWIGATIAMTLSALIGLGLGRYLMRYVSERNLKIGSACLFLIVGIVIIIGAERA